MDELVKLVQEKTGLSEAQALQATELVVGFIKEKLPEPLAGQIDAVLQGDLSGLLGQAQGLLGGLGGMLGKSEG